MYLARIVCINTLEPETKDWKLLYLLFLNPKSQSCHLKMVVLDEKFGWGLCHGGIGIWSTELGFLFCLEPDTGKDHYQYLLNQIQDIFTNVSTHKAPLITRRTYSAFSTP